MTDLQQVIWRKYAQNPVLGPQGDGWQSLAAYNPAAWTDGQQVFLLYRAEGPAVAPGARRTSSVGLAISDDGITFRREPQPVLSPTEPYELPGGCEDPRLVKIGDLFYLTYTAFDGQTARLALASSHDLHHWQKHGLLFPDDTWQRAFPRAEHRALFSHGWSKSGAILAQPIGGRFWMFFGDTHIWAASSSDLLAWDVVPEPVLSPRPGMFDAGLVEPGPPPMFLPEGIWLGYNAADEHLHYSFAQALFAADDPTRLLSRSDVPLLTPTVADEISGQVPHVVFAEGLVHFRSQWLLYYGMADLRVGLAISEH